MSFTPVCTLLALEDHIHVLPPRFQRARKQWVTRGRVADLSLIFFSVPKTVTTLKTFVLAMVLHPEVYQRARAEIDRVVGPERLPDFEDREHLPYLECVVKEVFRYAHAHAPYPTYHHS